MNTQLLESRNGSPAANETTAGASSALQPSHPPSLIDRFALRVGVALIIWSRRTHKSGPSRDRLGNREEGQLRNESERERAAREARQDRLLLLDIPRR